MRILVTGASGFLGSHLTDRLLSEGHSVLGVDNFSTGDPENIAHLRNESRFQFEERDICAGFDPGKVDYVFNMASPASPPEYLRLGIETLRVGSVGVENTLNCRALRRGISSRFHFGVLWRSARASAGRDLLGQRQSCRPALGLRRS
jgi:dTDP-glucose 4,6-dehydratase